MKFIYCAVAAFLASGIAHAQDVTDTPADSVARVVSAGFTNRLSIGLEIGATQNKLLTNISTLQSTSVESLGGYSIGVPIEYQWKDRISFLSNPGVIQKNYTIRRSGSYVGVFEDFRNTYVQLPVAARYTYGKRKMKLFVNAGLYAAYWMTGHVRGTVPNILNPGDGTNGGPLNENQGYNFDEKYQFNGTRDNRLEFGWLAGLGVSFDLSSRYKLFTEARFTQSLTDQQKKYMHDQVARFNQTIGLSVGCLVRLSAFKKNQ